MADSGKPMWIKIFGWTGYGLLCGAFGLAGTAMGFLGKSPFLSEMGKQYFAGTRPQEVFNDRGHINILILGCDEDRTKGGKRITNPNARSDMMMVAKVDFDHKRISGISIPRDLEVSLPGHGRSKINASHAFGGKLLAKQAAEEVLDITIDKVVVLNFKAFQEMVDLVGGIDVFVKRNLTYHDRAGDLSIEIKSGRQHLDGHDAMGYVRYRHRDSDFARQDRQKEFMLAFKEAVKKDPTVISAVAEKAVEMMGNEINDQEMAALALFAQRVGNDNIKMGMVPTFEQRYSSNLLLDPVGLQKELVKLHFRRAPGKLSADRS
ncbi:MAG: Transcriptional regulator LytR [Fimbriimonadaceae bacterium]|nr:Transcriptional regulator LytR [Fimbriimonadaceae bacterium]